MSFSFLSSKGNNSAHNNFQRPYFQIRSFSQIPGVRTSKYLFFERHSSTYPFPVAQTVKNLPAMQETWVPSQGWEDPLERE